jgi:hypothetical protein
MMLLFDQVNLDAGAGMRITENGYLVAMPRVARSGIQLYGGDEMGRSDMRVVRVYRPEEEVFNKDSLHSFAYRPVTNDHPPEAVTAANWKQYATGGLDGEVLKDGEFIRIPMTLMDKAAVKDVQDGKRGLSMGYTCDIEWTAGTTPQGEQYDAIQRNIRANHLAVVAAGRGGDKLRVGDTHQETEQMTTDNKNLATITVDSVPLTIDATAASVINAALARTNTAIADLQAKLSAAEKDAKTVKDTADAAVATHATTLSTKDAEIATLKKQLEDAAITPAKLDALVAERQAVVDVATVILGDKLVVKDQTVEQIKKQVVDAKLGETAKTWNGVQVDASFAALTADVKPGTAATTDTHAHRPGASVLDVARAFSAPARTKLDDVYAKRDADLSNAWKNDGGNA